MTSIIVTCRVPGIHQWPDAPNRRHYLRNLHRHVFHARVELQVYHSNREVEMHDLQEVVHGKLISLLSHGCTFSCESLAEQLLAWLRTNMTYGAELSGRYIAVEVWEDGENGARITYNPLADPSSAQTTEKAVDTMVARGAKREVSGAHGDPDPAREAELRPRGEPNRYGESPVGQALRQGLSARRPSDASLAPRGDEVAQVGRKDLDQRRHLVSRMKRLITEAKDSADDGREESLGLRSYLHQIGTDLGKLANLLEGAE